LERFNREIGRRTDDVGIFPDDQSLIRLATMIAIEQNDEWFVGRRCLSVHSMETLLGTGPDQTPEEPTEASSSKRPEQPTSSPTRRALPLTPRPWT
jgi:hypothetical protein